MQEFVNDFCSTIARIIEIEEKEVRKWKEN